MDIQRLKTIFSIGETISVEFKKCSNGVEADTYETVCSFLNRYGGDIYLGVTDEGAVSGISSKAIPDIIKNFIKMINNPNILTPTIYLEPETIYYEGKWIIKIHVPASSEVHSYKKIVYDRIDDADIKVTATSQIAAMYIRKQNIFTEKRVFKYVKLEDLRLDLLSLCRQRAINKRTDHPWKDLDDEALLKSAGIYGTDYSTGDFGINLAGIMLLGKDEVIQSICPAYKTDAILRKVNMDRYDDREIIKTNLIESYELLLNFAKKHLWDKFYLEDNVNISLRDRISREMLVNTLIHREMTSSFVAKFIIEENRMYIENANRAIRSGIITPENLEPNPKNPIIASFFNQIGYADELGSGTRNLFKYVRRYTGKEPQIIEDDIFKIIVPLDNKYSFDAEAKMEKDILEGNLLLKDTLKLTENEKTILRVIAKKADITQEEISKETKLALVTVKRLMGELLQKEIIVREGSKKTGKWHIKVASQTLNDTLNDTLKENRILNDYITLSEDGKILYVIESKADITQKEISQKTGLAFGTVRRLMKILQQEGIIVREGSKKTGKWHIKKKEK